MGPCTGSHGARYRVFVGPRGSRSLWIPVGPVTRSLWALVPVGPVTRCVGGPVGPVARSLVGVGPVLHGAPVGHVPGCLWGAGVGFSWGWAGGL